MLYSEVYERYLLRVLSRCLVENVRYRGGLTRKPIRVLTKKKDEVEADVVENLKEERRIRNKNIIVQVNERGLPRYERLGANFQPFIKTLTSLKSQYLRQKSNKVLLEGSRLIKDAINAGVEMECLFFSREESLYDIPFDKTPNAKFMKVLYKQLSLWSSLTTCPGIMGVFKKPDYEKIFLLNESSIPLTIICDNIHNPGILGSIIRSGAAIGCQKILLTKGCIDIWDPKVLRTSCGAHFHIPIENEISWDVLCNYIPENANMFLIDNIADSSLEPDNSDECFDSNELEIVTTEKYVEKNNDQILTVDPSYNNEILLKKYNRLSVPEHHYTEIRYENDCVLLITEDPNGVNPRAIKLISEYDGCRITISTEYNVKTLNLGLSMAIIGFEIKRQFSLNSTLAVQPSETES